MIFQEKEEQLLTGYDIGTGEAMYQANLGMLVCEKIITLQNAYYEDGGHDYLQVAKATSPFDTFFGVPDARQG
jgi:hypothetical protein